MAAQRSVRGFLIACAVGVAHGEEPAQAAANQNPNVRAAAEWVLFVDDKRIAAFAQKHSDTADALIDAIGADDPPHAMRGALEKVMASCDQGESVIAGITADYKTRHVLSAVKEFDTARLKSKAACMNCLRLLKESKDPAQMLLDPESKFEDALVKAMMMYGNTQRQRSRVEAGAQKAWRTLRATTQEASPIERDARLVCAWVLFQSEVREKALGKVQLALRKAGYGDLAKAPSALKAAGNCAKRAASTVEQTAKRYPCANVSAASAKLHEILRGVEKECGRLTQLAREARQPALESKFRTESKQELRRLRKSLKTPEERAVANAAAKRVLGRK